MLENVFFKRPKTLWEMLLERNFGKPISEKELSGIPPLSFLSNGSPLTAYSITGATEQNGEPSPESPVEVCGVGNKTGNLCAVPLDASLMYKTTATSIEVNGNAFVIKWAAGTDTAFRIVSNQIHLDAGTYTISWDMKTNKENYALNSSEQKNTGWATGLYNGYTCYGAERNIYVASTDINKWVRYSISVTVESGDYIVNIAGDSPNLVAGDEVLIANVMLNEGSTALPYEPSGYKIPILTSGKNLFNPKTTRYEYALQNNGLVVDYPNGATYFVKAQKGEYTVSINDDVNIVRVGCTNEPFKVGVYISRTNTIQNYTKGTRITIDNDRSYVVIQLGGAYVAEHGTDAVQLEFGTTATAYEPYTETTTNIYTDRQLYSGDKISYPDGTRTNKTGVLRADTLSFRLNQYGNFATTISNIKYNPDTFKCNKYSRTGAAFSEMPDGTIRGTTTSESVQIKDLRYSTVEDFMKSLSDCYIYYELAEPTTEPITLPEIGTLQGNNVLSVGTEFQPENVTVKYYKKP